MAPYTVVNLREVEDMAPRFGLAPNVEARFPTRDLGMERAGLSLQRLQRNARQPFGHKHDEQEETYVLLEGSSRVKLDDEIVELRPMEALRVAPGVMRCFEGGPEGAEFLAFGAPRTMPPGQDLEMVPGWWSE